MMGDGQEIAVSQANADKLEQLAGEEESADDVIGSLLDVADCETGSTSDAAEPAEK